MGLCESCVSDVLEVEGASNIPTARGIHYVQSMESVNAFRDVPREFHQMYKIGPILGYGTTSKVYAIKQRTLNTPLACKVVDKKKLSYDVNYELIITQLRAEIKILKHIQHENIVMLYDVIETRNAIYIITEYVSGGELFNHIIDNGPLKEMSAKSVMKGIFSALLYLHSKGVIHRDIKAENVLINPRGDGTFKGLEFAHETYCAMKRAFNFFGSHGSMTHFTSLHFNSKIN